MAMRDSSSIWGHLGTNPDGLDLTTDGASMTISPSKTATNTTLPNGGGPQPHRGLSGVMRKTASFDSLASVHASWNANLRPLSPSPGKSYAPRVSHRFPMSSRSASPGSSVGGRQTPVGMDGRPRPPAVEVRHMNNTPVHKAARPMSAPRPGQSPADTDLPRWGSLDPATMTWVPYREMHEASMRGLGTERALGRVSSEGSLASPMSSRIKRSKSSSSNTTRRQHSRPAPELAHSPASLQHRQTPPFVGGSHPMGMQHQAPPAYTPPFVSHDSWETDRPPFVSHDRSISPLGRLERDSTRSSAFESGAEQPMSPRTEAARKVESGHMLSRAEMSLLLQGGATAATPPTAATRSPLEAQLEASRLAHASDRQVEQQLLQSKQKAESTLKRAKSDLNIASKRIQAQQAEIEILQGRNSALRIAGEDAMRAGTPMSPAAHQRFSAAVANDKGGFMLNEDMRELLDLALIASKNRLGDALQEAERARAESEQADNNSKYSLETAIHPLEHDQRMTARALLAGSSRASAKLRGSLKRLEIEARVANSTHIADLRSVITRLLAQREAVAATCMAELRACEEDGAHSIRALLADKKRLLREVQTRDAEVQRLIDDLEGTKEGFEVEKRSYFENREQLGKVLNGLKDDVDSLTQQLGHAEAERDELRATLEATIREGKEREQREGASARQALASAKEEARAQAASYEQMIADVQAKSHNEVETLKRRLTAMGLDFRDLERSLRDKLEMLTVQKDKEIGMLRSRNERLKDKVMGLKANTSRGRAELYWANIKSGEHRMHDSKDALDDELMGFDEAMMRT